MSLHRRSPGFERTSLAPRESTYVERDEFLSLLLSRREMVRADGPHGKVRGLLDLQTGRRYLIEQAELIPRRT